jgi:hypothetical protein
MIIQEVMKTADLTRCSPPKAAVQLYKESGKKSRIGGYEGSYSQDFDKNLLMKA